MIAGRFITCALALGLWFAGAPPLRAESTLPLPTPHSHYETFPPGISGLPLLQNLVQSLDPQTQKTVLAFVGSVRLLNQQATPLSKEQALARLKQLNWNPWKPILLEFVVHQSQALEMLPVKLQASVYPIVHDSLLYFLDHLPDDRLLEKFVDIAICRPARVAARRSWLLWPGPPACRRSDRSSPEINRCRLSIGKRSSNWRTGSTR